MVGNPWKRLLFASVLPLLSALPTHAEEAKSSPSQIKKPANVRKAPDKPARLQGEVHEFISSPPAKLQGGTPVEPIADPPPTAAKKPQP